MGAARKLEYYEDYYEENKYINKKQTEYDKTKQVKVQTNTNHSLKTKQKRRRWILRGVLLCAVGALLYTNQGAQQEVATMNMEIEKLNTSITEMKNDLMALDKKNQAIRSEIDVVNEATTKLGLVYPEENQKVYFQINENDSEDEQTIFTKMHSMFTGKLD